MKIRAENIYEAKPGEKIIPIRFRLPTWMLNDLKVMANKQDVPYQSLIKMILAEKLAKA